jgi:hypothetical protein
MASCFLLAGCSQKQFPAIVLEEHPTVAAILDEKLPHLPPLVTKPLGCEAAGIEDILGKFQPIMYLAQPTPRYGGSSISYESSKRRTFKVYRGVNEVAAKNKFLGEYEIIDPGYSLQELQAMIGFKVTAEQQLLLCVTDMSGTHTMNVRRIDASSGQ